MSETRTPSHPRAGEAARTAADKQARDDWSRAIATAGGRGDIAMLLAVASNTGSLDRALNCARYYNVPTSGFLAQREERQRSVQQNSNSYRKGPQTIDWADVPEAYQLVIYENKMPGDPAVRDAISRWLQAEHPEGLTRTQGPPGSYADERVQPPVQTSRVSGNPAAQFNADADEPPARRLSAPPPMQAADPRSA